MTQLWLGFRNILLFPVILRRRIKPEAICPTLACTTPRDTTTHTVSNRECDGPET